MEAEAPEARILLPWPPSANNMFVNVRGRGRVKSADYTKWRDDAGWLLKSQRPHKFTAPVLVTIELCSPNKRPFDIDNRNKGILDLLVEHQVIPDDSNRWVRGISTREVTNGAPVTVHVELA